MIAILGALLEENDVDSRLPRPEFTIPGEYTDMEINRVAIYNAVSTLPHSSFALTFFQIMELASMRLLLRTSPPDRIDGPPTFKSAISQDTALLLAKQLQIPLNDLLCM
jgi:origin recognition complex subunit 5